MCACNCGCIRPQLIAFADQGMLDQLLMNLAVNARDAMPGGGQLAIETGEEVVVEELAQQEGVAAGRYVWLRVVDTGSGIPPQILPHIFEPFYTTKEAGKGTGLGLATVFGIVNQHRGWIKVDSTPGKGSRFQVYFPASGGAPVQSAKDSSVLRGGTQTILFVEDDEAVRVSTAKLLQQFGYRVLLAASGVEALTLWKAHAREVQVLVTDIVMPGGINGQALASQLLRENPQLRVILTSGYSVDLAGKNIELHAGEAFIQKPFSLRELLETIRSSLQGV
ncbi:MAG: ATP-binding protein [Chthoniobacteraceae bacterium]